MSLLFHSRKSKKYETIEEIPIPFSCNCNMCGYCYKNQKNSKMIEIKMEKNMENEENNCDIQNIINLLMNISKYSPKINILISPICFFIKSEPKNLFYINAVIYHFLLK